MIIQQISSFLSKRLSFHESELELENKNSILEEDNLKSNTIVKD